MWSGQCLHKQSCLDVSGGTTLIDEMRYQWTDSSCAIQVKILESGILAIVHEAQNAWPVHNNEGVYPDAQSHVNANKTVSYFYVQWDTSNVDVGKVSFCQRSCLFLKQVYFSYHSTLDE